MLVDVLSPALQLEEHIIGDETVDALQRMREVHPVAFDPD